jgi:ferrous iron transport protein A
MPGGKSGVFGLRRRHRHHGGRAEEVIRVEPNLNDVTPGVSCRVKRLWGQGAIRRRLLDMGIVPGAEVTVIRSAPLRDPIEIRIGDSFVTVRRTEAMGIEVSDV